MQRLQLHIPKILWMIWYLDIKDDDSFGNDNLLLFGSFIQSSGFLKFSLFLVFGYSLFIIITEEINFFFNLLNSSNRVNLLLLGLLLLFFLLLSNPLRSNLRSECYDNEIPEVNLIVGISIGKSYIMEYLYTLQGIEDSNIISSWKISINVIASSQVNVEKVQLLWCFAS